AANPSSGKRIGDLSSPKGFCRVPLSARGESLGKRPLMLHVTSAKAVALLAVLLLSACRESKEAAAPAQAAVPVKVAAVIRRDIPEMLEAIGQTRGSIEVEIRVRIEGFIDNVLFAEGTPVRK